ncbi:hypothetical protein ACT3CD_00035 [Geofilum sp. OHC36d9]|uniref:hypothetical protein n=1 Tax=Geofilum sp. OHC36d9 TaxID=3458413 RepID=UPI0040336DED
MKTVKTLIILNLFIFLFGCDKSDDNLSFSGEIIGFVNLIDNNGVEIEDKSSVKVSIEGSGNSVITDEDGRFELTNVKAGTYNIIYDKADYGLYKLFSYQFIGGDVPAFIDIKELYELPNVEFVNLDMAYTDEGTVFSNNGINFFFETTETYNIRFTAFFDHSEDVSKSNYDYKFTYSTYSFSSPLTEFLTYVGIDNSPYTKGETVYIKVYFCNFYEDNMVYDYDIEDYMYTSYIEASDVIKFTIQ